MAFFSKIRGTFESLFQIGGTAGGQVKNVAGPILEARNAADAAYIIMRGGDALGDDDLLNRRTGDLRYGANGVSMIRIPIALVTVASVAAIPAGAIVLRSRVTITTPYSGGTLIDVGDTGGTADLYFDQADNDPQTANIYETPQETVGVAATITATITGAPVAGAGFVSVEYTIPAV